LEEAVHERARGIEARILEHRKRSEGLMEDLTAIVAIASAWEEPSSVRRILKALRGNEAEVYESALTLFASNVPEFVELDDRDAAILRRAPVRAYHADKEFLRTHPDSPKRMEQEFAQVRATDAVAFAAALSLNKRLSVAKSLIGELVAADRESGCTNLLEAVMGFPVRDVRILTCEACGRPPSCAEDESLQPATNL
jgi:hypothetical protein